MTLQNVASFQLNSVQLEIFLEPACSNHYLCSILRRFHIGFSFWRWSLLPGTHTYRHTHTHTYIHSFVLFKGILLWERGEEVERYQRGKLYNILSSLFVNTAVYGVFKCACTLKQTKLRVRTGVS